MVWMRDVSLTLSASRQLMLAFPSTTTFNLLGLIDCALKPALVRRQSPCIIGSIWDTFSACVAALDYLQQSVVNYRNSDG